MSRSTRRKVKKVGTWIGGTLATAVVAFGTYKAMRYFKSKQ